MTRLAEYLGTRSAWTLVGIGLAAVLAIGIGDYLAGLELSLFILYLAPVMIVSSLGGIRAGLAISLAAAAVWLLADLLGGRTASRSFIPYWNAGVRLLLLSIVVILQNALSREKTVARTDHLTGMANRLKFYEAVETELQRARRYEQPFSVAYIDIDNFKEVNDLHGHAAGDELLRSVGRVIHDDIRAVDLGARLGGDEFAILLPQSDAESARGMLTKLQNLLTGAISRERWPVTFSIGVATFLRPPASVDEIIRRADGLMYEAKQKGKDSMQHGIYGA
jgi:diguanylate cyclase (GGDEF)-like protein